MHLTESQARCKNEMPNADPIEKGASSLHWRSMSLSSTMSGPTFVQFGSKYAYLGDPSQIYAEQVDGMSQNPLAVVFCCPKNADLFPSLVSPFFLTSAGSDALKGKRVAQSVLGVQERIYNGAPDTVYGVRN